MSVSVHRVLALIDWDTTRRCLWLSSVDRFRVHRGGCQATLDEVAGLLARTVAATFPQKRIKVDFRLYHGWHHGNEPTQDYRALQGLAPSESRFANGRVLVTPPIISDTLACGGPLAPMRDTLRRRDVDAELEQKMVDTAIAADLLFYARQSTGAGAADSAFIIVSEDDDMIPPVVVARYWGVTCSILRTRSANRCLPRTAALLLSMQ